MNIVFKKEELRNLDMNLAKAMIPVLEEFKCEYEGVFTSAPFDLDLILEGFNILAKSNGETLSVEDSYKVDSSIKEFSENFRKLWI